MDSTPAGAVGPPVALPPFLSGSLQVRTMPPIIVLR